MDERHYGEDDESFHWSEAGGINVVDTSAIRLKTRAGRDLMAQKETRAVNLLKAAVFLLLLLAATSLSILTYFYTSRNQNDSFVTEFRGYATKITDAFHDNGNLRVWSAYSLSVAYTSEFHRSDSWPNATLPDFGRRAVGTGFISSGKAIAFAPIVTNETREGWEVYALNNFETLIRSVYAGPMEEKEQFVQEQGQANYRVRNGIERGDGALRSYDADRYSPVWQVIPYTEFRGMLLLDLLSIPLMKTCIDTVTSQRIPVISEAFDQEGGPASVVVYPVFRDFSDESPVVGTVSIRVLWEAFFRNVLPSNARGLVAVLRNSCSEPRTFEINGTDVRYLGEGDRHDRKYDDLEVSCFLNYEANAWPWTSLDISSTLYNSESEERMCDRPEEPKDYCLYSVWVYPSDNLRASYKSQEPVLYTIAVALIFVFTTSVFVAYDYIVERRQRKISRTAAQSSAIVSSLFPEMVRDRVVQNTTMGNRRQWMRRMSKQTSDRTLKSGSVALVGRHNNNNNNKVQITQKLRLKSYLTDTPSVGTAGEFDCEPIAEMFPDATVMFADIAGFTAWSSEREPTQVFILLETLYRAFDEVANQLNVFKVETIGDCYVAVAGLPDPNERHAVLMTWFAYECLRKMKELTRRLEVSLGPGTSDLSLRVGLHSGPVTAGVLRGEKSRFQLFGDTVNTAARMESTGEKNLIHASKQTSELLKADGKASWVTSREDVVFAKGKGEMQTFWLKPRRGTTGKPAGRGGPPSTGESSSLSSSTIDSRPKHTLPLQLNLAKNHRETEFKMPIAMLTPSQVDAKRWGTLSLDEALAAPTNVTLGRSQKRASQKRSRLVDWNVDLLLGLLSKVVASRDASSNGQRWGQQVPEDEDSVHDTASILDEVTEIIRLPGFGEMSKGGNVVLPGTVRRQLREYVSEIAAMYRDNPFHNLEHASHVTMSAVKLMRRIMNPDVFERQPKDGATTGRRMSRRETKRRASLSLEENLYESTFGISSDPLTQFSVVFSALIHDIDHRGVPNAQLVKEKHEVAIKFGEKSAAEQHSVVVAWTLLMEPRFWELRSCIYSTEEERKRFRQLVVNAVMATDILDLELQLVRKKRWNKAFSDLSTSERTDTNHERNRKATSVIEHIIQASDVAHTMQHWHIFIRWNERLFEEMYISYKQGRCDKDPSVGWYEGQIRFFDNYIIPLAQKLKDCGVFGVAGNEYLSYALENRREWEMKGREETEVMLVNFNLRHGFFGDSTQVAEPEEGVEMSERTDVSADDGSLLGAP